MSVSQALAAKLEALKGLMADLKLDPEDAFDEEDRDQLRFGPEDIRAGALGGLAQATLDSWFESLGEMLVEVRVEAPQDVDAIDLRAWSATGASHDAGQLRDFLEQFEDEDTLQRSFSVNKGPWVESLRSRLAQPGPADWDVEIIVFFSAERLTEILAELNDLEFEQFCAGADRDDRGTDDRLLLILVADVPGRVIGPYLAIFGQRDAEDVEHFFTGTGRRIEALTRCRSFERLRERRSWMAKSRIWDDKPRRLTPDFLKTDARNNGRLRACRQELVRLQNLLALGYLADRTTRNHGRPEKAFFAGPSRSTEVAFGDEKSHLGLFRLYQWAYELEEATATRTDIVRQVVTHPAEAPSDLGGLIRSSLAILTECRIQLSILLNKNLADSFTRRREISALVRDYGNDVAERIRSLTKELTDNTYKTVGLLLAVFFAYLLKPQQSSTVFLLAVVSYVLYLLFVRCFYIGSIYKDHQLKQGSFHKQKKEIEESGLLADSGAFRTAEEQDEYFTNRRKWISAIYTALILLPLLIFAGWSWQRSREPSAKQDRQRALQEQAEYFTERGYKDVRIALPGGPATRSVTHEETGVTLLPDITAIDTKNRLVVIRYEPCADSSPRETLEYSKLLAETVPEQGAKLQFLTPIVCGDEPGAHQLRRRLQDRGTDPPVIWSR